MAIKTKPKKQQQPRHAAYAKQRNKRIQQKERLQKARSFNDHGAALGKAGRNEEALQYFEQSLAINPHDIHVLNNYGLTLNVLNRYEEAIIILQQALAINPHDTDALIGYGFALKELKRYDEAITYYEQALAINPQNIHVLNNCGTALQSLKRYEEAIQYLKQALAINPQNIVILKNYGNVLIESGRYNEAIIILQQALAINPRDVRVLYNYGNALYDLTRYEDAITYYKKALAINPQDIDVLNNYGTALHGLKRYEDAIRYYKKALTLNPQDVVALRNHGLALVELGHYKEAIAQLEKALEVASFSEMKSWFSLILGILHYRCQLQDKGDSYFQSAIEDSDDKDAAKIKVAQEMFAEDHYSEKGVAILQEITETSPHYQKAFVSLKSHLSPKAYFGMFNTRPAEEHAINDTGLLNRALYHKIANELVILKETVHLLLSGYRISDPKLTAMLERIDAILEGVKQRRAQEKAYVQAIPAQDYDALLAAISRTAHDISDFVNNELATIEERIRLMLVRPFDNEALTKKLNKMLAQIKISQNALNDLKSVNEGLKLRYRHFRVAELFENWQMTLTFRHAVIALDIRNEDARFYGDAEKIKSFLKELVENASRHNPDKADLQIRLMSEDVVNPSAVAKSILPGERKFLRLTVSDNGKGIPSDKKDWVFLPLNTTSDEGSGLGLFIIQRTVKEMHGQIAETGTDGARFEIYIPYSEGDEEWNM